ncbi:unnamed protein product, partial [Iphiclides podalirius]
MLARVTYDGRVRTEKKKRSKIKSRPTRSRRGRGPMRPRTLLMAAGRGADRSLAAPWLISASFEKLDSGNAS